MGKQHSAHKFINHIKGFLALVLSSIVAIACNLADNESVDLDFHDFNEKFYNDSIFQIARVKFPFYVKYTGGDSYNPEDGEDSIRVLTKSNWTVLRQYYKESDKFIVEFDVSDSVAVQKIYIPDSGFKLNLTFKKDNHKWYLVGYDEQDL